MRYLDHVHVVGFEETNLVGNISFANRVRWQGRVRKLFLRQRCPEVPTAGTPTTASFADKATAEPVTEPSDSHTDEALLYR